MALACLLTVVLALARLDIVTAAMRDALHLCATAVVPSLFPFMVLTSLLLSNAKAVSLLSLLARPIARLLGLSGTGAVAFLFGTLFGFPIGAKVVAEGVTNGSISREEGERLLLFSNNASPAFLIGSVGLGALGSAKIGVFLFFLQFFVSLTVGILTRKSGMVYQNGAFTSRPRHLTDAVRDAIPQILAVCGYILFFSVLSALLTSPIPALPLRALLYSLFELGSGCAYASRLAPPVSVAFCGFSVCFSGLSVYFQCKDAIRDTSLTMREYLPVKLLCGTAAALLCYLGCVLSVFG